MPGTILEAKVLKGTDRCLCLWGPLKRGRKKAVKYIIYQMVIKAMGKGEMEDRYPGREGSGLQKGAI